jgi:isopenicillin-N N-acyltransferase-like protein
MKEISLSGSNYEIGLKHGTCLKSEINDFLNDGVSRINFLSRLPIDNGNISDFVSKYSDVVKEFLPDFYEEINGIADGAQILLEKAMLLQFRREVLGVNSYTLMGDCTSFGIHKGQNVVLGQTIDLNGDMTDLGNVYRISKNNKPEILQYSFAGLLGYMGTNSLGLSVVINLVVSDDWKIGISPYLLVRKFLEFEFIEDCLEYIKNVPIASSRSFIISDKNRQINLEITPNSYRIIEEDYLSHTNHFLHKDFKEIDRLNFFSKNSSIKRKEIIDSYLKENHDFDSIKNSFKDHSVFPVGICAHNNNRININETVAAVIMFPNKGEFYALKGKPCEKEYKLFNI